MPKKRNPATPTEHEASVSLDACAAKSVPEAVSWCLRPVQELLSLVDRAEQVADKGSPVLHERDVTPLARLAAERPLQLTDWCLRGWTVADSRLWATAPPKGMPPDEAMRLNTIWRTAQEMSADVRRLFRQAVPHGRTTVVPDGEVLGRVRAHYAQLVKLAGLPSHPAQGSPQPPIESHKTKGAAEPHPESLASTNRSALDLAGDLRVVLEWFDCIRAADRDIAPTPRPHWWDGYAMSDDWRMYTRRAGETPNRSNRIQFTALKAEQAINFLLAKQYGPEEKWKTLTDAIPIHSEDQSLFVACKSSLRNLSGMLGGGGGDRLFFHVPPEEWHIAGPLPETWAPEPETEEERTEQDRVDEVCAVAFKRTGKGVNLTPADRRKIDKIRSSAKKTRTARLARNEAAAKLAATDGRVTADERERQIRLRHHWRHEIKRWRLGEADITRVVDYLEADPKVRARPSAATRIGEKRTMYVDSATLNPVGWTTGDLAAAAGCSARTMGRIIERLRSEGLEAGPAGDSTWKYEVADVEFMVQQLEKSKRSGNVRYAANLKQKLLEPLQAAAPGPPTP